MIRLALGLVVLCLALVVGCGGDTEEKNDYVKAVNKAQNDFLANVQKMSSSAGTPDAAKQAFTDLDSATDKVISDLEAIDAPDDVKDLHQDLIASLNEFKQVLAKTGDALSSNDPQELIEAQTALATDVTEIGNKINATTNEINQKLQE